MVYELTTDTILIFAGFIIFVFLIYKLFRVLMKGALIAGAGFSFPWIVQKFALPLNVVPSIEVGIQFASVAVGVYLIYEFSHFIKYFFKVAVWPIKLLKRRKK